MASATMEELFARIDAAYHGGGISLTGAVDVVDAITHAWKGVADVLTLCGTQPDKLDCWRFYLIDGTQRHCLELRTRPPLVVALPLVVDLPEPRRAGQASDAGVLRYAEESGNKAAGHALLAPHNTFACLPVAGIPCTVGSIWVTMWRADLLGLLQAQLKLHSTPAPLKVLRRLARSDTRVLFTGDTMFSIRSIHVLGSLVCWQCGRMAADLHRCGRCQVAWYCDRACQVQHLQRHKRTCKHLAKAPAAAGVLAGPRSSSDGQWAEQLVAAVLSNARAAELVEASPEISPEEQWKRENDWQQL